MGAQAFVAAVARATIIAECRRLQLYGQLELGIHGSLVRARLLSSVGAITWYNSQQLPRLDGLQLRIDLGRQYLTLEVLPPA
jgi:hypothetical protein